MLPSHSSPSPVNPSSQVQLKPIIRSTQVAFSAQGLSSRHSLISNGINFVKIIQLKSCTKITLTINIYRPQRSWGKVMFLHVSVILFTGESASVHAGILHPPPGPSTPRDQTPPWDQAPPGTRHPQEQTPPWSRHTPSRSRHPPGPNTPWSRQPVQCMLGDMGSMHPTGMQIQS